ncbi:DUF4122 domain-containing protein [Bacteroidales bacterium OttesenSCG-928-A17]|nr:DUF4122 domain-containing protein [Bacteroidales bacterium OttesenSCG-928-A17]
MAKIFITIVVLYALFVTICLLRLKLSKRRKKDIVGKGNTIPETGNLKTDIVGKSKYEKAATTPLISKSTPLATTSPENEKGIEKPDTFAPPNEVKPSAEVPPEELDEAFSDTPPEDETELMDIDYPLEYEPDETDDDEEEETEEVEGTAQAALASGVQFDDLGNAVRTVNRTKEATPEEKKAAGDTLLEIRQTDMFEQVVSGKPDARETVTLLMNASLSAFHKRKDKEAGNTGSGRKAPDSFDMRDFA